MAKLIILEGLSRTGKTTISNKLESEGFGRIISLIDKRPIDTDIQSFYKGVASISNEFYKAFPEETFILDRSFLSELVYCEFFEREPSAEDKQRLSVANLNDTRAKQIQMEVAGEDAESQLDFMSMAAGDPKVYS